MKFAVIDVVSAACAIFRINDNKVVRDNPEQIPTSKQMIIDHFLNDKTVEITDSDREQADTCIKQLQHRLLMAQLSSKSQSEFVEEITQLVLAPTETIGKNKLGLAVWIPKVVQSIVAEDQKNLEVARFAFNSKYVGKLGEKVELTFNPFSVKFVREYNCFRHFGHDEHGNLIGFLNKTQITGPITGRVKTHNTSKYHNGGRVTYLNYVKGVK